MATSNVQLQQITSQLASLGVNTQMQANQIQNLTTQINNQKNLIASADKTNTQLYVANLEKLYNLQTRLATLKSPQVSQLLQQKIQILEQLTS